MELCEENWVIEGTVRIPLLGEVAAGQPLEVYSVEDELDVPEKLWNGRKVFALRVRGQSMVDAGIHDGDYLIVEPREHAENGRTVVAEVEGRVTVKKLYRGPSGQVRLQPANPEMLPLLVGGDRVRVIGVVVGILRKYGFSAIGQGAAAIGRDPEPRQPKRPKPLRSMSAAAPSARGDEATLELALNAIDTRIESWREAAQLAKQRGSGDVVRMEEMGRDLQALRDWCARTRRAGLRREMIAEAERLMQRMDRFLSTRALDLPGPTLH